MPHYWFTYIIYDGYSKQKHPVCQIYCDNADDYLNVIEYIILRTLGFYDLCKSKIPHNNEYTLFIPTNEIELKKYDSIKYAISTIKIMEKPKKNKAVKKRFTY